jgi:hypothetical protein
MFNHSTYSTELAIKVDDSLMERKLPSLNDDEFEDLCDTFYYPQSGKKKEKMVIFLSSLSREELVRRISLIARFSRLLVKIQKDPEQRKTQ